VLSLLPNRDKTALHTTGRLHSPAHALLFGLVAYASARISQSARTRVVVFVGVLLFGFGIELAEHFTYRAALEWKDVLVDSAGVLVGTVIAIVSAPTEG
jgi:VanZ family protein